MPPEQDFVNLKIKRTDPYLKVLAYFTYIKHSVSAKITGAAISIGEPVAHTAGI